MANSLQLFAQWWRTWKTFPVYSWIQAAQFYRRGAYAEAENCYRRGLVRNPFHPARASAHLDYAYCLFKQRKIRESEVELKKIIASYPELREGYIRLARLQMWLGRSGDASLTLRRGGQRFVFDADICALLLLTLIDQEASRYLIAEAIAKAKIAIKNSPDHKLLRIALARCAFYSGERERGKAQLAAFACEDPALFEAVLIYAEVLLLENKAEDSLRHLRRALQVSPNHPRVLSLIAKAYLADSPSCNPDFSQQLAIMACQSSAWISSRDLHQLAESYVVRGDKLSALVTASRAKEVGGQSHKAYEKVDVLDSLIKSLTSELQAQ